LDRRDDLSGKRLVVVVSTAPERGDLERAERIARAAHARGAEVSVFLMADAVGWGGTERTSRLAEDGIDVVLCGTNSLQRRVSSAPGVLVGSQDDHAALVHRADRVVAFT
jgi:sulfur relay (sulfurtransferase) complex TusBCD TusD component (DsrE family)